MLASRAEAAAAAGRTGADARRVAPTLLQRPATKPAAVCCMVPLSRAAQEARGAISDARRAQEQCVCKKI